MADPVIEQLKARRDELSADLRKYEAAIAALEGAIGTRRRVRRPDGIRRAKASGRGRGTAVTKIELSQMLLEGMTGAQIAAKLGVSMPTVHNYKKKFGLTTSRGSKKARKTSKKSVKRVAKRKAGARRGRKPATKK